jgi:hypothetical protein
MLKVVNMYDEPKQEKMRFVVLREQINSLNGSYYSVQKPIFHSTKGEVI